MKYVIEIIEHNVGQIEIEASSKIVAEEIASSKYYDDPQNVDWYQSETTFNGMSEDEIFDNEMKEYDCCDCNCTGHCEECFPDNECVVCGSIIPEGRMICPNCESQYGGEEDERQKDYMEQRKSESGELAGRFRSRISRLFGR